jgi:hypothetical protein
VGDVNGDGYPDLIVSFINSGTIGVYLNDGTGAFGDPSVSTPTARCIPWRSEM